MKRDTHLQQKTGDRWVPETTAKFQPRFHVSPSFMSPCVVALAPTYTNPYLPFQGVTHKGPGCLEVPPDRRPWMMKMVPTTMPTRPTDNPRAHTTVSVSSDMGAGISGSKKEKFWSQKGVCSCMCKIGPGWGGKLIYIAFAGWTYGMTWNLALGAL